MMPLLANETPVGFMDPYLQYGALGILVLVLIGFGKILSYFADRDREREERDRQREIRMAAVIDEHQKHARAQAAEISQIALASVKAIEEMNRNSAHTTRILEHVQRRFESSDRLPRVHGQGD